MPVKRIALGEEPVLDDFFVCIARFLFLDSNQLSLVAVDFVTSRFVGVVPSLVSCLLIHKHCSFLVLILSTSLPAFSSSHITESEMSFAFMKTHPSFWF